MTSHKDVPPFLPELTAQARVLALCIFGAFLVLGVAIVYELPLTVDAQGPSAAPSSRVLAAPPGAIVIGDKQIVITEHLAADWEICIDDVCHTAATWQRLGAEQ